MASYDVMVIRFQLHAFDKRRMTYAEYREIAEHIYNVGGGTFQYVLLGDFQWRRDLAFLQFYLHFPTSFDELDDGHDSLRIARKLYAMLATLSYEPEFIHMRPSEQSKYFSGLHTGPEVEDDEDAWDSPVGSNVDHNVETLYSRTDDLYEQLKGMDQKLERIVERLTFKEWFDKISPQGPQPYTPQVIPNPPEVYWQGKIPTTGDPVLKPWYTTGGKFKGP